MTTISIDLETFSDVDIAKCGAYKYAASPNFEILLFGYSIDGGEVKVIDLAQGESIPEEIIHALLDENVLKTAYNAVFERVCLSTFIHRNYPALLSSRYIPSTAWKCTLVWAAYCGYPLSLKDAGAALGLEKQKLEEGKELIRYFCVPCNPTKANGGRTRNLPEHAKEKWEAFVAYNKRDVEVEMKIQEKLSFNPVPDSVWEEYHLDQDINDRGILVDMQMVKNAINMDKRSREELTTTMQKITELENPNSVQQLRMWLGANGMDLESLGKKDVAAVLPHTEGEVKRVLQLRQQLAKSSVKKYHAMENATGDDNRARGMFQFYGANRTGRFAGRLVQLQNLPQNHLEDLEGARALVRTGNYEALNMLYEDIPDTLSQLIRTAFIPSPGYRYYVADFSAIEARVLSFLAGEQWRIDVFAGGGDIYCKSASQMFKVPVVKHGINGELRAKGKVAELACIAEGSLVLTDQGLVPIEDVTTDMKVWDGEAWEAHEGVIYKGEREVITYEGLTATPDHLVWIEGKQEPIQFGIAATSGAHLVQTGDGWRAIRLGENNQSRETVGHPKKKLLCSNKMHWLRRYSMGAARRFTVKTFKGLRKMFQTEENTKMAGTSYDESKATMRKPQQQGLQELWRAWYKIRFSWCHSCWNLDNRESWFTRQKFGNRSNRHERKLRTGEYTFCNKIRELWEQKKYSIISLRTAVLAILSKTCFRKIILWHDKRRDYSRRRKSRAAAQRELASNKCTARLYDIRNAGRYHRFTVSNCLVHNCGYGGSTGALISMGALEMGLKEDELKPLVDAWRNANPNIVKLWWNVDNMIKQAIKEQTTTKLGSLTFEYAGSHLFIHLPSGRKLAYVNPRMGENRFGGESIHYDGMGATKKWETLESYGPKFVENIIQGISRDILCYAMRTLRDERIVAHVHDELIIECTPDTSLEDICDKMGQTPPWIEGLLLRADGYVTDFYKKD